MRAFVAAALFHTASSDTSSTASHLNKAISGYEPGEIPAQDCTTAEIVMAGLGAPLQAFIDGQYLDSKIMSRRPGMHLKYLPYLYD